MATVDADGDGKADLVVGPGRGGEPYVKVLHGETRDQLGLFLAYDASVTSGLFVVGVNG